MNPKKKLEQQRGMINLFFFFSLQKTVCHFWLKLLFFLVHFLCMLAFCCSRNNKYPDSVCRIKVDPLLNRRRHEDVTVMSRKANHVERFKPRYEKTIIHLQQQL